MIVFDGLPALSPFRLERLNSELERVHSGGRISAAWHVYFVTAVDSEQALDLARSVSYTHLTLPTICSV